MRDDEKLAEFREWCVKQAANEEGGPRAMYACAIEALDGFLWVKTMARAVEYGAALHGSRPDEG